MASIEDVILGIENALQEIDGLRTHAHIPDTIDPPAAAVTFEECDFDSTLSRGSDDLVFLVHIFTSAADAKSGQRKLYDYIDGSGGKSVKAAIDADSTLGGIAMYAVVERAEDFGKVTVADIPFYGVKFTVRVCVAGMG